MLSTFYLVLASLGKLNKINFFSFTWKKHIIDQPAVIHEAEWNGVWAERERWQTQHFVHELECPGMHI